MILRAATEADHARVLAVFEEWWDGRPLAHLVLRPFFVHFGDTSLIGEDDAGLAAFLVGFLSQTRVDEAYVHLIGVRPDLRGSGVGRRLYERFFELARERGRSVVTAQTALVNERSIAFHRALGFESEKRDDLERVLFRRAL